MKRVLFVCTGNVCRSPMAAALFERQARERNEGAQWLVESAGTWALDGQAATGHAETMMAHRGLDIRQHRAHTITATDVENADVVLVMTNNHRQALAAEFTAQRHKIHLLGEVEAPPHEIADPYGGLLSEYEICANELERLVHIGYDQIKGWSGLQLQRP